MGDGGDQRGSGPTLWKVGLAPHVCYLSSVPLGDNVFGDNPREQQREVFLILI